MNMLQDRMRNKNVLRFCREQQPTDNESSSRHSYDQELSHKSTVISLYTFKFESTARKHLVEIVNARNKVVNIRESFYETQDVRPVECDQAIKSFLLLRNQVESFLKNLPEQIGTRQTNFARHNTLMTLSHYAEEQINDLISLINLFRFECCESSMQTLEQQRLIYQKIEILIHASVDIEKEGERLLKTA